MDGALKIYHAFLKLSLQKVFGNYSNGRDYGFKLFFRNIFILYPLKNGLYFRLKMQKNVPLSEKLSYLEN